jgi:hypothetical protein
VALLALVVAVLLLGSHLLREVIPEIRTICCAPKKRMPMTPTPTAQKVTTLVAIDMAQAVAGQGPQIGGGLPQRLPLLVVVGQCPGTSCCDEATLPLALRLGKATTTATVG